MPHSTINVASDISLEELTHALSENACDLNLDSGFTTLTIWQQLIFYSVWARLQRASGADGMGTADRQSINKYREISKRLSAASLLGELGSFFHRKYALSELLDWMHERLEFDKGNIERHNDPKDILAYGRGRCGEFSILFTSLCLAHGYRARLILDMSDHVWTEIWNEKQERWIHVDPSEKRIDDPYMYERDWKKNLKEIYAFEKGTSENVTKNYKMTKAQPDCQK